MDLKFMDWLSQHKIQISEHDEDLVE